MDLAPNHNRALDRSHATICAVSSTDGETLTERLISTLEKLTGPGTNVPFRMMGWLRAQQEGDPAHSLFTHFPHTYQLDRANTAPIRDSDHTGRRQTALPHAFYS
jgi:hypothetical protein